MVLVKVQGLSARQSLPSKGRCTGLFVHRHGGKRPEDSQRPTRMGR